MKRRLFVSNAIRLGLVCAPFSGFAETRNPKLTEGAGAPGSAGPKRPLTIYNNWSAYDELSDNIPLTEALAMKQLGELIRMKKNGVQIDYYVMDAFWFDHTGGYRVWHRERWPQGPDKWIKTCQDNDIMPGMWFSTNDRIRNGDGFFLDLIPEWKDSETTMPEALCLFAGGYLSHLAGSLQYWADKGVRAFKFDFARFGAASATMQEMYLQNEIEEKNKSAFIAMLKDFRRRNPEALIIGYNGFGGEISNTYLPFRKSVDARWLEVFDTLYCGDPRFSDVPAMNSWRSQDIYSDHMVRQYERNGLPLRRIDNCGYMTGVAGTCYKRGMHCWKGMQILELARGGWVNVYHGNLEFYSDEDLRWFARCQAMYMALQAGSIMETFGGLPGEGKAYGFVARAGNGTVYTIVNPSQAFVEVEFPVSPYKDERLIYSDGGYVPVVGAGRITIGPEQLVVAGSGQYALPEYSLGTDETIQIPETIQLMEVVLTPSVSPDGYKTLRGELTPPAGSHLRLFVQQFGADGFPRRSSGGPPPGGRPMDTIIRMTAKQNGKMISLKKEYDKMIWSGLSWGAAGIDEGQLVPGKPLFLEFQSTAAEISVLKGAVFAVTYKR